MNVLKTQVSRKTFIKEILTVKENTDNTMDKNLNSLKFNFFNKNFI